MNTVRREIFERVFDDLERWHSAFEAFTEIMPLQDVDDDKLRYAWECFRAGWNESIMRPMAAPLQFSLDALRTAKLESALRRVARETDWCPVCEQNPSTGHRADCALEAAAPA